MAGCYKTIAVRSEAWVGFREQRPQPRLPLVHSIRITAQPMPLHRRQFQQHRQHWHHQQLADHSEPYIAQWRCADLLHQEADDRIGNDRLSRSAGSPFEHQWREHQCGEQCNYRGGLHNAVVECEPRSGRECLSSSLDPVHRHHFRSSGSNLWTNSFPLLRNRCWIVGIEFRLHRYRQCRVYALRVSRISGNGYHWRRRMGTILQCVLGADWCTRRTQFCSDCGCSSTRVDIGVQWHSFWCAHRPGHVQFLSNRVGCQRLQRITGILHPSRSCSARSPPERHGHRNFRASNRELGCTRLRWRSCHQQLYRHLKPGRHLGDSIQLSRHHIRPNQRYQLHLHRRGDQLRWLRRHVRI